MKVKVTVIASFETEVNDKFKVLDVPFSVLPDVDDEMYTELYELAEKAMKPHIGNSSMQNFQVIWVNSAETDNTIVEL